MIVVACQQGCGSVVQPNGELYCACHAQRPVISNDELEQLAAEASPRGVVAQVALGRYQLAGKPPSARARVLAREYCASLLSAEATP